MGECFPDHGTGTRSFNSSNQFVITMILRGVSSVDWSTVVSTGFSIRNRLPSGLRSHP